MNRLVTQGIVLRRVDYGEADRIVTILTPDRGKVSLMARGVRKLNSKMAGAIELFSISEFTYLAGRSTLYRLVSAQLNKHFSQISKDISRTMSGYELLRLVGAVTEDETEPAYYHLLADAFTALDDNKIPLELVRTWFSARLLVVAGYSPNLITDANGEALLADSQYSFNNSYSVLERQEAGLLGSSEIKYLRLLFSPNKPRVLAQVQGNKGLLEVCEPIVQAMRQYHLGR